MMKKHGGARQQVATSAGRGCELRPHSSWPGAHANTMASKEEKEEEANK